jgi:hypothetical protein
VAPPRRILLEESPGRVIVAAARGRANEGQAFGQIAATLGGSVTGALQKKDSLIGEPEVLRERNLVSLVPSDESVKDKSQPFQCLWRGRGARFVREAFDLLSDAP